jgi:uncharacterized membrane protein
LNRANLLGYGFALVSSIGYGSVTVIAKKGLLTYGSPIAAVSVSLFAGTLCMALLSLKNVNIPADGGKKGLLFFLLSGLMAGAGQLFMYLALGQAPVVVVTPITNITPLLTILLVYVFLRGMERVTLRVTMAAGLVVAGVILISMGRVGP